MSRGSIIIFLILLADCAAMNGQIRTPTPTPPPVSEQQAIERAGPSCGSSHLRVKETPYNIRAQLTYRDGALVWIVEMEGTWQLVGGPVPSPTPLGQAVSPTNTPMFFHSCCVVVDAIRGQIIQSGGCTNK